MTLPMGSIIQKVDVDTQVSGEINTCEAVSYIDDLHATCLSSSRYVGLFVITLFGAALYYKIN